jgi:hypothetical protein
LDIVDLRRWGSSTHLTDITITKAEVIKNPSVLLDQAELRSLTVPHGAISPKVTDVLVSRGVSVILE